MNRARASVQVIEPVAGVTYVLPVAAVSYILISYSAELDTEGRYPYITDTVVVADQSVVSLAKALFDSIASPNDATAVEFAKALDDTATISDVCVPLLILLRSFADTFDVSDASVLDFGKALTEAVTANDVRSADLQKVLADNPAVVDAVNNIDFAGTLEDIAAMGELITFVIAVVRTFNESVSVADTNVFDLGVNPADGIAASESQAFDYSKPFTESSSVADLAALGIFKPSAETVTLSDGNTLVVFKNVLDTVTATDDPVIELFKAGSRLNETVLNGFMFNG